MNTLLLCALLGLTAAAADAFGGAVVVQREWNRSYLKYFVALGSGFMLATAINEMLPASFERVGRGAMFWVLAGYLLVHFFEHAIAPHFHYGEETHPSEFIASHSTYSVLLGLVIHTFFDGIAIASSFLVSRWLGWIVFLAVFLHKVPEGFTVSSVMLAGGRSRRAAWWSSALLGASTLAGVLLLFVVPNGVAALPLAAGVTIYVAASDLIPEVNREPGVRMALLVFIGVGLLFALDHLFHVH